MREQGSSSTRQSRRSSVKRPAATPQSAVTARRFQAPAPFTITESVIVSARSAHLDLTPYSSAHSEQATAHRRRLHRCSSTRARTASTAVVRLTWETIVKGLQICTPVRPLGDSVRARFANLTLANDNFHRPSTISLVLGADAANHVVTEGFMPSQNGLPMAQSTIFGWMVSGSCSC
ncbi:hypothetical protein ACLKA6_005616 [Drosophila palustris]